MKLAAWAAFVSIVLAALSSPAPAAKVECIFTLNEQGSGELILMTECSTEEASAFKRITDPKVRESLFVMQFTAPAEDLRQMLENRGLDVTRMVDEKRTSGRVETRLVRAKVNSVRALGCYGGKVQLEEKSEGNLLEMDGTLGGLFAEQAMDLSPLKGTDVDIRIRFPGSVKDVTGSGSVAWNGRDLLYHSKGDELLGKTHKLYVRIIPDVEGAPYFWLVLILGVTGLVVMGAIIVFQRGREAIKTGELATPAPPTTPTPPAGEPPKPTP
jgi:hypothetical protein